MTLHWFKSWEVVRSHHMTPIAASHVFCVRVHAGVFCRVLRERTSDGAARPYSNNRSEVEKLRIADARCQRGDITLHIYSHPNRIDFKH
ncbi:hypothetical protein JOB18_037914 [Solea senegalensis]|uniref:Uncharacterized protein n=1 Tax=Solea senegalensis TaxID=28829 RepID=A0AAV6RLF6_SOLSE|nr:hypothetical protein JOB18_037914 [Solea senegalensis]